MCVRLTAKKENYLKNSTGFTSIMESIQQGNKEHCLIVKPVIKTPLLLIQSFITTLWVYFVLFGWIFITVNIFLFSHLSKEKSSFIALTVTLISLLISFLVVMFLVFLLKSASLRRTEYKFYSDKLEYYEGFLVKNKKIISYDRISYVGQRKRIIEGRFGLGTVFIESAGSSPRGHELEMRYLENPDEIYNWISKIIAKKG